MYEGGGEGMLSISQADLGLAYCDSTDMMYGHTNPHNVGGRVPGLLSIQPSSTEPKPTIQASEEELNNFYTAVVQDSFLQNPIVPSHHLDFSGQEKTSVRNGGSGSSYGLIPGTTFRAAPTPLPIPPAALTQLHMRDGPYPSEPLSYQARQHGSGSTLHHHMSPGDRSSSDTGGHRGTSHSSQKRKIRIRTPGSSPSKKKANTTGTGSPIPYYHHYHHHHHHHHHRKSPVSTVGSELDEDMEATSPRQPLTPTDESSKKQNHSEIEKRRRDKMNTYIVELSGMVPMCNAMSRKLDKITVLRMTVQHMKSLQRSQVQSYTQGHHKPFITDEDLKHITLQSAEGFLFVVGCERGRFLYLSDSVSKVLNFAQSDLVGQSWFDILHPKDVVKVKEQLSAYDATSRETFIDFRTMLPVEETIPQRVVRLCPGARRSFFCRMRCKPNTMIKEEMDTPSNSDLNRMDLSDRKYSIIHCTGYLKTCGKTGKEESDSNGETSNLTCLVAVGRILPSISNRTQSQTHKDRPVTFTSRHAVDGKFIFVDQRATLVVGFLPQELLGISMYGYYHQDDIGSLARTHKSVLSSQEALVTQNYRFRAGDASYVTLQSTWKAFRNPWTRDIECVIASNTLILSDTDAEQASTSQQEYPADFDFFANAENKESVETDRNIEQMIEQVEAGKIGQKIADESKKERTRDKGSMDDNPVMAAVVAAASAKLACQQQSFSNASPSHVNRIVDQSPSHSPHGLRPPSRPSSASTNLDAESKRLLGDHSPSSSIPSLIQPPTQAAFDLLVGTSRGHAPPGELVCTTSVASNETITITNLMPVSLSSCSGQQPVHSTTDQSFDQSTLQGRHEEMLYMMTDSVLPESPHLAALGDGDGNDEAAMSVIMSLLEADAGLGGPVDFSGLPWPLP